MFFSSFVPESAKVQSKNKRIVIQCASCKQLKDNFILICDFCKVKEVKSEDDLRR